MDSASSQTPLTKVPFLGFDLVAAPTRDFARHVLDAASSRYENVRIAYLNAHTCNLSSEDAAFAAILRGFTHLYPDGQAVVWASRWLGRPAAERINAADFIGDFFCQCAQAGRRIAFIGGREGEAQKFADHHRAKTPNLNIVFTHHGFFSPSDEAALMTALHASNPHIVLVGMGSPRQEEFVLRASTTNPSAPDSSARVWWCIGALFEYDSGTRLRAPKWMRRTGLEWLFRLAIEPARMWKRYLVGNPKFILRVLASGKTSGRNA